MGFAGKSALVTGAGGGMGLAIAEALLAEGAHVALVDLKPPAKAPGGKSLYLQGDVSDEAFVADAFARARP